MSLADFSERDFDRLADHLAGVLDPPAAAEVERLIRSDPGWAAAFAEVQGVDSAVRAELRATGQAPEPMPADIVARLDNALAAQAGLAPVVPIDRARSGRHVAGSGGRRDGRRRGRQVAGWAAAAALLVAVGTGVVVSWPNSRVGTNNTSGGADSASAPPSAPSRGNENSATGSGSANAYPVRASGTDYTPASLAAAASSARNAAPPDNGVPGVTVPGPAPSLSLPQDTSNALHNPTAAYTLGLGRLADAAALRICIEQITTIHPGVVVSIDYARYEATPAVIVVVHQTNGAIAVAVGANCGLNGPDEIASASA